MIVETLSLNQFKILKMLQDYELLDSYSASFKAMKHGNWIFLFFSGETESIIGDDKILWTNSRREVILHFFYLSFLALTYTSSSQR